MDLSTKRIDAFLNSEAAKALAPSVQKFGSNAGVGTTFEEIWEIGAAYNFLSTAATLYMGSSSASDTAVSVTVEGLDANWDMQIFEVALDASDPQADQVAVITAGGSETWIRTNRAYVSGATAAVGNIYIADEVPGTWGAGGLPGTIGNTVAYISIADQQTSQAIYSTPRNKTAAITSWEVSNSTAQAAQARLQIREFGGVFRTRSSVIGLTSETWKKAYDTFLRVPPRSDIQLQAEANATTADFIGEFDIYSDV